MKSIPYRNLFSLSTLLFTTLLTFVFTLSSIQFKLHAQTSLSKQAPIEMLPQIEKQNSIPFAYPLFEKSGSSQVTNAYSEYDPAKYLLINDNFTSHRVSHVKKALASNLPNDVSLVIVRASKSEFEIYDFFDGVISSDRIKIINARRVGGASLWTRDHAPIPVFNSRNELKLVDAKYFHNFEADRIISNYFNVSLLSHSYYFEGGNFIADNRGNCFVVNRSATAKMDNALFEAYYGCNNLIRFKKVGGMGHVDERVKLLSDFEAITDTPSYVPILEEHGYKVTLLPKPQGYWETYINSLLINNTIFVPIFNDPSDQEAIDIYSSFGFEVVPLNSSVLSNNGNGSIHCITMTYPEVSNPNFKDFKEVKENKEVKDNKEVKEVKEVKENGEGSNCHTKVNANLRLTPRGKILKVLPKGTPLKIIEREWGNAWVKVRVEDNRFNDISHGWLHYDITVDCSL